ELAVELPEPRVVAHPVRAQVDEPCLTHAPVVVGRRVAGSPGELGIPVHALHHIRDVVLVAVEEARDAPPVAGGQAQRLDAVQTHAHADVPAANVGVGQRTLHHPTDIVAL